MNEEATDLRRILQDEMRRCAIARAEAERMRGACAAVLRDLDADGFIANATLDLIKSILRGEHR